MATCKDNLHVREKLVELLGSLTTVQVFCDMDGDPVSRLVSRVVAEEDVDGLADHLIANGVTVQEWISVSERLPEKWQNVLVCRGGKEPYIEFVLSTGDWERDDISSIPVTHWMPLPSTEGLHD